MQKTGGYYDNPGTYPVGLYAAHSAAAGGGGGGFGYVDTPTTYGMLGGTDRFRCGNVQQLAAGVPGSAEYGSHTAGGHYAGGVGSCMQGMPPPPGASHHGGLSASMASSDKLLYPWMPDVDDKDIKQETSPPIAGTVNVK